MKNDENLLEMERSIKVLKKKIESLSKKPTFQKYNKIPKIEVRPSQLPFVFQNYGTLCPKESGYCEEENDLTQVIIDHSNLNITQNKLRNAYTKTKNWKGGPSNLIAFPNLNGHFIYDAVNDLVTSIDDVEARLWGWDKNKPIRYADVLAQVENKEKFLEETLGHYKSYKVTSPIQINNGSLIREELTYHFHPDDYEGRSLLRINGTTELLKIV